MGSSAELTYIAPLLHSLSSTSSMTLALRLFHSVSPSSTPFWNSSGIALSSDHSSPSPDALLPATSPASRLNSSIFDGPTTISPATAISTNSAGPRPKNERRRVDVADGTALPLLVIASDRDDGWRPDAGIDGLKQTKQSSRAFDVLGEGHRADGRNASAPTIQRSRSRRRMPRRALAGGCTKESLCVEVCGRVESRVRRPV